MVRMAPVPPSGWPRAMAPPLGLTVAGSGWSSRCQARTTEANASLISVTAMSSIDEAGAAEQVAGGVDGAGEHEHRVAADQGGVDDAGPGPQPEGLGLLGGHHQHGAGAVGDLRRGAGRVAAALGPTTLSPSGTTALRPARPSRVVSRRPSSRSTRWVSPVGLPSSPRSGASIGHDLAVEAALGPGLGGEVLRALAELVELVAADAPLLGDELGALELGGPLVVGEVRLGDGLADALCPCWSPWAPGS